VTAGRSRAARALAVTALASLNLTVLAGPSPAAAAARDTPDVLMTVVNVTPTVPRATYKARPLDVQLRLVNTTGEPIDGVQVVANRGDPLPTQNALDASLADHAASDQGLPIEPDRIVHWRKKKQHGVRIVKSTTSAVDLPADGSPVAVTFSTTLSKRDQYAGICLCTSSGIYPLHFRVQATADGTTQTLGGTTTYLPSFYPKRMQPVGVSWVWPLIDRPHRLAQDNVFTDDDLTDSVALGGRLSRALTVVEDVGDEVPITLVIDPELLDELEVMKTGRYVVENGTGKPLPGRGADAASAWLDRLATVLSDDSDVTVQLTPYADPDFETLTQRGLSWTTDLPAAMAVRVQAALAGRAPQTDLAWPASSRASADTLDRLRAAGTTGILLASSAVTPRVDSSGVLASVAHVRTAHGSMTIGLTTHAITQDAGEAVGASGASVLPELVAEIAIRAAEKPLVPHTVIIRAPREIDPSPTDAAAAIRATSTNPITHAVSLQTALYGADTTPMTGRLVRITDQRPSLPPRTTRVARAITHNLPALTSLLGADAAAKPLLAGLPLAVQRLESSAWQVYPEIGRNLAAQLSTVGHTLLTGVHFVKPRSGSYTYTLASDNSPLPVTVQNDLPYTVQIQVRVSTVNGLTGFTQRDPGKSYSIDPNSKVPLKIAAEVRGPGRIALQAQVRTPDGSPLGDAVSLNVHSTALGVIGIVITVAAGAVLAIALLIRLYRRLRRRRRARLKAAARAEAAVVP